MLKHFLINYLIFAGVAGIILGVLALTCGRRLKRLIRLARAVSTDRRLPRAVRWLFGVSLAVKALPIPDFGVDEAGFIIGMVLLNTLYRETWAQIRSEVA